MLLNMQYSDTTIPNFKHSRVLKKIRLDLRLQTMNIGRNTNSFINQGELGRCLPI